MASNQFSEDPDIPDFRKTYNNSNDGINDDDDDEVTGTEVSLMLELVVMISIA